MREMKSPEVTYAQWIIDVMNEEPFTLRYYTYSGRKIKKGRDWTVESSIHINSGLNDGTIGVRLQVFKREKINFFFITDEACQFWADKLASGLNADEILAAWREHRQSTTQEDEEE